MAYGKTTTNLDLKVKKTYAGEERKKKKRKKKRKKKKKAKVKYVKKY